VYKYIKNTPYFCSVITNEYHKNKIDNRISAKVEITKIVNLKDLKKLHATKQFLLNKHERKLKTYYSKIKKLSIS